MYINLFGIMRVFEQRKIGEDLLQECIQQTVKFGGGKCNGVGMHFLELV